MDKLNALPVQAKALVVLAVLGVIFGVFYFLVLPDAEAQVRSAQSKNKQAQVKIAKLRTYGDASRLQKLEAEEKKLRERLEANKAMLPSDERMADLTEELAQQADERGLVVLESSKGEIVPEDYVKRIPVDMHVQGTLPALISFLDALAQPGMRLMTVTDLELKARAIKDFMPDLPKMARSMRFGRNARPEDIQRATIQNQIALLDAYDVASKRATIDARFTVNAYSYTGKLAPPVDKKHRRKRRRRR